MAIACASLVVCVAEGQGIVPGAVDDLHLLIQANQKDYAALRDKMLSETPGPWDVAELHRRLEWPERVAPAGEDFVVVRRIESGIRRG